MKPNRALEELVAAVAARLEPRGFACQGGGALKKISGNAAIVVEFQKSDRSVDRRIVFTVNIGLIRKELLDSGTTGLREAEFLDAHLKSRLGRFLPEPSDRWWELTGSTEFGALATELSDLLLKKALPYFEGYLDADSLIALWESGKSPGLTAVQRARYLHQLKQERGTG